MKKRVLSIFLIMILIVASVMPIVNAIDSDEALNNILGGTAQGNITGKASSVAGTVISVFQVVGVAIAIIMLLTLAMKYMMASPGDKADIKKHAVPYVIGAVCLFAASGILEILEKFAENINNVE